MIKWSFPSRSFGPIDGPTDAGLMWFKDEPIRALARELCQNSLDAVSDDSEPVRIDFVLTQENTSKFPGIKEFKEVIRKCEDFWSDKNNKRKDIFLNNANKTLESAKFNVLRVSDFNTIGLSGAFDSGITVWKSLVQGNGISMKDSEDAAGSYGIGKAAPFVNSFIQTVFYRTLDEKGVYAAQGVAQLMAFEDHSYGDDDPIRRATGYYGESNSNTPVSHIVELDEIAGNRTETGTDVFIMGFNMDSGRDEWYASIITEILENFFMSIINEKLIVKVGNIMIDKESVHRLIARFCKSEKGTVCYRKVINNEKTVELNSNFHNGQLRLRLLYGSNLNKNILITRNSGMKIAEISGLPKGISYTGILEIKGSKLNSFFKDMEDPQHRKWDVKRHDNPALAKEYKTQLENWVKNAILENSDRVLGESTDVYIIDDFLNSETYISDDDTPNVKNENIIDDVKSMNIRVIETVKRQSKEKHTSNEAIKGRTVNDGNLLGFRTPTQDNNGNQKRGRKGIEDSTGKDKVYKEIKLVKSKSRVIRGSDFYSLNVTSERKINEGKIEIFAIGENGRDTKLKVKKAFVNDKELPCVEGCIQINNINANDKLNIKLELAENGEFGMRVNVYGN